jgi:hypothetical protein
VDTNSEASPQRFEDDLVAHGVLNPKRLRTVRLSQRDRPNVTVVLFCKVSLLRYKACMLAQGMREGYAQALMMNMAKIDDKDLLSA